ncbi:hypothetical protein F4819DRAFT_451673 [Hypoxylon fuscum]|nr:hypothetical protein F4819DRAFT_451673 [Hypoxylon fuscum]
MEKKTNTNSPMPEGSFRMFPLLPRELRNMIWAYASPKILPLRLKQDRHFVVVPVSGCFHANREAREEIARHAAFLIEVHHRSEIDLESEIRSNPSLRVLCKSIRQVVICDCILRKSNHFLKVLQSRSLFPHIRKVNIVQKCIVPLPHPYTRPLPPDALRHVHILDWTVFQQPFLDYQYEHVYIWFGSHLSFVPDGFMRHILHSISLKLRPRDYDWELDDDDYSKDDQRKLSKRAPEFVPVILVTQTAKGNGKWTCNSGKFTYSNLVPDPLNRIIMKVIEDGGYK